MDTKLVTLDMQKIPEGFAPADLPLQNVWIRICGLSQKETIVDIGHHLGLHKLSIEDILNHEHPKYEQHRSFRFFILKTFNGKDYGQIAIILKDKLVVTFEDEKHNFISHYAKEKLSDDLKYVVYELLDRTVDHYVQHVHAFREKVDAVEDELIDSDGDSELNKLFSLRRQIRAFRRLVRPVQGMAERLQAEDLYEENMSPYLKDLWDHASKVNQTNDAMCESLDNFQNEIFTRFQYKLSKNMNVMTALSITVMPMLVITGFYGMNLQNLPGTGMPHGYLVVVGVIIGVVLATFFYVKRKML
jgi:magnesium transporter